MHCLKSYADIITMVKMFFNVALRIDKQINIFRTLEEQPLHILSNY